MKTIALLVLIFASPNTVKYKAVPGNNIAKRLKVKRPEDLTHVIEMLPVSMLV